jgi:hypothetical protein
MRVRACSRVFELRLIVGGSSASAIHEKVQETEMSIAIMREALSGVSGVPVTAYDGKGDVEPSITAEVYERVAAAGIHNIVAAGNTGEFYALTPREIRIVHEAAVAGVDGKAPVTAAIGRSLREAISMAKDAAAIGATAVMSHQPVDPFAAPSAQIDYFCDLADASAIWLTLLSCRWLPMCGQMASMSTISFVFRVTAILLVSSLPQPMLCSSPG